MGGGQIGDLAALSEVWQPVRRRGRPVGAIWNERSVPHVRIHARHAGGLVGGAHALPALKELEHSKVRPAETSWTPEEVVVVAARPDEGRHANGGLRRRDGHTRE